MKVILKQSINQMLMFIGRLPLVAALMTSLSYPLLAASVVTPDAGAIQQSSPRIEQTVLPDNKINLTRPLPEPVDDSRDTGPKISISTFIFKGNSLFSDQQLLEELSTHRNKDYSFTGLNNIAKLITRFYRKQGYLMATAYIAEQDVSDQVLEITILEGFIEEITAESKGRLSALKLTKYFHRLQNIPLNSADIERQFRLLNDRNVVARITFSPGNKQGTAALKVEATELPLLRGSIAIDNKGNRYTNETRASGLFEISDPLSFGSRHFITLVSSGSHYHYKSLMSDIPIGYDGLILRVSIDNMDYMLGEEFKDLSAQGKSQNYSVGLSYPWVRSFNQNLYSDITLRKDKYEDNVLNIQSGNGTIKSMELDIYGDYRQSKHVVSWGLTGTAGKAEDIIQMDENQGSFHKLAASIKHNFIVTDKIRFVSSANFQYTTKNLVSAQKFTLGGSNGVRAYPQGEGSVDRGLVSSFETFYQLSPALSLNAFFDFGVGQETVKPIGDTVNNHKKLSGVGLSLSYQHKQFGNINMTAARRTESEAITAPDKSVRLWLEWNKPFDF
ncbi:MAG: hypothetical protein OFPII_23810 [Osedax symbiont Rs1]|nr:MAG: hypothetical protein OFPII_23810 [Osedax symbiont Rs1]